MYYTTNPLNLQIVTPLLDPYTLAISRSTLIRENWYVEVIMLPTMDWIETYRPPSFTASTQYTLFLYISSP